jgi:hypothetical protein
MNDLDLIQLYQDLTASRETLARSVAMFVQSLPLTEPDDPVQSLAAPSDTEPSPVEDTEPSPGAED